MSSNMINHKFQDNGEGACVTCGRTHTPHQLRQLIRLRKIEDRLTVLEKAAKEQIIRNLFTVVQPAVRLEKK